MNYQDLVGPNGTNCGADFSRVLALVDRQGVAVLAAAYKSAKLTIRKRWALPGATDADADVIAQVQLGAGIEAADDSSYLVTVPGASLVVPPRVYVYDLRAITLLDQKHLLVYGNFEVLPRATASPS